MLPLLAHRHETPGLRCAQKPCQPVPPEDSDAGKVGGATRSAAGHRGHRGDARLQQPAAELHQLDPGGEGFPAPT